MTATADLSETNIEFKLQCTHQYSVEDLNQFYQDYQKLVQSFNLIQYAVQEQIKIMREGFKKKRHNQFYTGSPQRATSSLLCTTCKESSTNSINCHIQLINQFLLPIEIKNPAKLINCSQSISAETPS